jgi:hypothetical protein
VIAVATLLTAGNSDGERRCDGKCHDAKEPACDCVCGGRYHGCGGEAAMDRIQDDLREGRFGAELAALARHLTEEATQDRLF